MPRKPRQAYSASLGRWGPDSPLPEEEEREWAGPTDPYRSAAAHRPRAFPRGSQRLREESEEEEEEEDDETKMSSWTKVSIDEAQTPDPEKRQRPGWIPRLLDINPYKTIQQSSYSPPDGYSNDFEDGNSFEELFGQQYHPSADNEDTFERYQSCQQDDSHTKDVHRDKLYMEFYQQIDKEYKRERPSDCVIVSISKDQAEYSTTIGHRLQDHGLVVEMIYLTSESGLTRALQEVKNDGSPFCVLVEPSNVTLCSCTVIMLHQIIKIHRNMPMEDALALIAKEFQKIFAEHEQQQRTEISHKAADLMDDYLERENFESYHVPLGIRHLLFLLSEGKHLYAEELNSISDYLKTRRNKLEGFVAETNAFAAAGEDAGFPNARPSGSALPPTLSKPPPLLPTPGRAPGLGQPGMPSPKPALLGERPMGPLLPTPAPMAGPKGKPPPLLRKTNKRSMHLNPPHKPTKRPLLGGRPGLLPTPAAQSRSSQHPWAPKRKF